MRPYKTKPEFCNWREFCERVPLATHFDPHVPQGDGGDREGNEAEQTDGGGGDTSGSHPRTSP